MNKVLVFLSASFLFGCTPGPSNGFNPEKLLGNWRHTDNKQIFYENWVSTNSAFQGTGFVVDKRDTIMIEHMQLLRVADSWNFKVQVSNQNNGESVVFEQASSDHNQIIFSNENHDYPQFITYELVSEDELDVQISGDQNGVARKQIFHFTRVD